MTATTPKIVQIANAWAPADDDAGLDAVDLVFALDNAGRVWKANMHGGDPWYQIETFPTPGHIIQIAVASAPREGHVALERLFGLCRDGSLWLKTMTVFGERAWVRVLEIPEQEIVQISVAWAPYDGSQGTLWARSRKVRIAFLRYAATAASGSFTLSASGNTTPPKRCRRIGSACSICRWIVRTSGNRGSSASS